MCPGEALTERFYLFFERCGTQTVDVPLVRIDQFAAPTLFDSRQLQPTGRAAPRLRLRTLDAAGEAIDAGRWLVIRDTPVNGLESVDAASNQWRCLPAGHYRVRGHALHCPWVFQEAQEFDLVEGRDYDVVLAANHRHVRCELRVQRAGKAVPGARARLIGRDDRGRRFPGAWIDVSAEVRIDLPVGSMVIEVLHAGAARELPLEVTNQAHQRLLIEVGS
ncbi:MAG: hypothetical protein KF830_13020 [Planctomycetes bacterium]|nr:hypothetical protein [Planctomycetota bacterium]